MCSKQESVKERNAMIARETRTGSASKKFGRDVRARNTQSTFDKPLACVAGIFDRFFVKPLDLNRRQVYLHL